MPNRKPVPPLTLANQIPPQADYVYFESPGRFPFRPTAVEFDPVNAGWLIDASLLVYGTAEFINLRIDRLREQAPEFQSRLFCGTSTQALALWTDEFAIIAFRGTRIDLYPDLISVCERLLSPTKANAPPSGKFPLLNGRDVLTNIKFWLGKDGIHMGFRQAFHQAGIREEIKGFLNTLGDRPVWFTGHSLGAALATIAAAEFKDVCRYQGLYTFGSPRVGNQQLAEIIPRNTFRIVNYRDQVTHVPLSIGGYRHVGQPKFIGPTGEVTNAKPPVASIPKRIVSAICDTGLLVVSGFISAIRHPVNFFRRLRNLEVKIRSSSQTDHAPAYYACHIWNAVPETPADNARIEHAKNHNLL